MQTRSAAKESHTHSTSPFFSGRSARAPAFFSTIVQAKCDECDAEEQLQNPVQHKCAECEEEQAGKQSVLRKLSLGEAGDRYEQEADRVADRVVNHLQAPNAPSVQTKVESDRSRITRFVMRQGESSAAILPRAEQGIQRTRGSGGETIAQSVRGSMEQAFGADFSRVRIHADGEADRLNRSLNARAFTTGRDVYFKSGEYQPESQAGQELLAHELTHVIQQSSIEDGGGRIQRWGVGGAPAPAGWSEVTDPRHLRRLAQAETIVRRVLASRNCQNFFRDNCTNGAGANALREAFDNARIYLRPVDDNVFGAQSGTTPNIAFNLRAFRIGRFMLASTLLHEMFHTCDPTFDARDELDAENAVETCRLHTPWIDEVSPRSGAPGARVTIRGWGFGPTQSGIDEVRIGSASATIVSWTFMTDNSSRVAIVAEVPAGAAVGGVTISNNRVASNNARFTVL